MKPHKHAELIKAWADGAEIQIKSPNGWVDWEHERSPEWYFEIEYRIKPEPKPDVVIKYYINTAGWIKNPDDFDANLRVIWDGETGELKSAEVLK